MFKKKKSQPSAIESNNSYTTVTTEQIVNKERTASLKPLATGRGPVPVAPANGRIQLTPIVSPIAFVPYSTQKQPLLTFDEIEDENIEI